MLFIVSIIPHRDFYISYSLANTGNTISRNKCTHTHTKKSSAWKILIKYNVTVLQEVEGRKQRGRKYSRPAVLHLHSNRLESGQWRRRLDSVRNFLDAVHLLSSQCTGFSNVRFSWSSHRQYRKLKMNNACRKSGSFPTEYKVKQQH